ncbi:hypothetical protein MMC22_008815 [Lobaria immixta]|nr:hypothetical protein [Lobaria immixta]
MAKPDVSNGTPAANGASSISPPDGTSTSLESSTVSRAKQALKALNDFQDAAKEMFKYPETLGKVEEALDRHDAMEKASKEKDLKIAQLESANQVQLSSHEKRWSAWEEKKSQLECKVKDLEKASEARAGETEKKRAIHEQSLAQVKKELETEKDNVAKLTKELEKANTKIQEANKKLNSCNERLKEWEGNLSLLKEVDFKVFDERMKKIFNRSSKIARTYFLRDLSKEAFSDHTRWDELPKTLKVPLSFPRTNSSAAKHMRMAAALHTLANQLCYGFFKPCYLPESSEAGQTLKEVLDQQYVSDPQKERTTRALLLSTYSLKEVDEAIKEAVQETTDRVHKLLNLIGGGEDSFRKEIKALFHEAANLWKEAQYSTKMVEASTTEDYDHWPWDKFDDFTSAVSETKSQPMLPKFEAINLFPCVYVPEIDHTVDNGCMLWPSQNTVIAAEQELAGLSVKRPKTRKPSFAGGRRFSSDGVNGVKSDERPAFLGEKQRATKTEEG